MRAILIGAGRMGLTHLALFNLLTDFRVRWTVIDPSAVLRFGLGQTLPKHLLEGSAAAVQPGMGPFDFAVITSPTMHHASAYAAVKPIAAKYFIEKPLRVPDPSPAVLCGYVMLHHPLQQEARALVRASAPTQLALSLRSNTVLAANTGWRGSLATGGGVLNEFGSHLLSLLVDLAGPIETIRLDESRIVHSVDAPDVARLSGRTAAGASFALTLDWTDAEVRKPTYEVSATLADGTEIAHDFYEARFGSRHSSVADSDSDLGVYLRGIEFTNQARHFLDNEQFPEVLATSVEVDRLLGILR